MLSDSVSCTFSILTPAFAYLGKTVAISSATVWYVFSASFAFLSSLGGPTFLTFCIHNKGLIAYLCSRYAPDITSYPLVNPVEAPPFLKGTAPAFATSFPPGPPCKDVLDDSRNDSIVGVSPASSGTCWNERDGYEPLGSSAVTGTRAVVLLLLGVCPTDYRKCSRNMFIICMKTFSLLSIHLPS